jgi:DNA-binding IclR family transcriptional regulator
MAFTYAELHKKTIDDLRAIAKDLHHDAVKGYTQMNKEHLLPALCQALGIDTHEHHHVEGLDKAGLKARMRRLKADRDAAIEAGDHDRLRQIRHEYKRLNHRIRAATV